ncbi:IS1182 family transposase [Streptosporangium sp. NPDC000396]|uniref:IS1182 family transposase n=1 Tax=Streptosporangium sp. NPDC000396 TaxID=3366185 RepID=UPI00367674DF
MPKLTRRVARAAFPQGTLALRLRDSLGQFFDDALFAEAFPADGRPAASPGALAMVSVMQFTERLTDRQAAEAVRARIDWKYLLGLELDDSGFDHTLLSRFRARLAEHGLEEKILTTVLRVARERGLLRQGGRQRTDSAMVIADVRQLNRMEFVAETLRAALEALAAAAPGWLESVVAERDSDWLGRYGERVDSWHGLSTPADRQTWLSQTGQDGLHLLTAVWQPSSPAWLRQIPAVEVLRQAWVQQYHRDEGGIHAREPGDLPPSSKLLISPYDTDARRGAKGTTTWTGYCVHLTETCDADAPRLITDVATTSAAAGNDGQALGGIHTRLRQRGLVPAEQLADSGYISAASIVTARREHDIDLVGPARPATRKRGHGDMFTHDDFVIDDHRQQATCPAGHTSVSWSATHASHSTRTPLIQIRFAAQTCRACPLQPRCTIAANQTWGRSLTLRAPALRAALQQRRREQETDQWRARYRWRAGIESTVCQFVHRTAGRHTSYKGHKQAHVGHCLAATAINLIRIDDWLQGHRPEPTRVTHLTRLLRRYPL